MGIIGAETLPYTYDRDTKFWTIILCPEWRPSLDVATEKLTIHSPPRAYIQSDFFFTLAGNLSFMPIIFYNPSSIDRLHTRKTVDKEGVSFFADSLPFSANENDTASFFFSAAARSTKIVYYSVLILNFAI